MEMEIVKTGAGVEASWSRSVVKNNGGTHEGGSGKWNIMTLGVESG